MSWLYKIKESIHLIIDEWIDCAEYSYLEILRLLSQIPEINRDDVFWKTLALKFDLTSLPNNFETWHDYVLDYIQNQTLEVEWDEIFQNEI